MSTAERFWTKVDLLGPAPAERPELGSCWSWLASAQPSGYGQFKLNGRVRLAHQVAWELLRGARPAGKDLDHLCRRRVCVNPSHLEPVDHIENIARGAHPSAVAINTNQCVHGHEFTPENTSVRKNGTRACKACNLRRNREHYQRARGPAA